MKSKLIAIFLLLIGGIGLPPSVQELYSGITTKSPTSISYKDLVADLPDNGWFKVTDAGLDVMDAVYVDKEGQMGNIYIPARAAKAEWKKDQETSVLVKIDDRNIRSFLEKVEKMDKMPEDEAEKFHYSNIDKLRVERPIQGIISEGLEAVNSDEKRALESADVKLSEDFVILQENSTPSISARIYMVLFSLAFCAGGVAMFFVKK